MAKISKKKYPDLKDLFIIKLKALYDIENELVKALPKMAKAATDEELKASFEKHLEETKTHVERLEEAFAVLDMKPATTKVEGVRGLVKDAEFMMKEIDVGTVKDASLISVALEVEHYEMAAYASAIEWAGLLGYDEIKESLEDTLNEEEESADTLTTAGAEKIFQEAMGENENTEE